MSSKVSVLTGLIIFLSSYSVISLILDHGSSCSRENECQNRSFLLSCNSGTCDCVNEPGVKLDEVLKLCAVGVEEICFRQSSSPEEFESRRRLVPCIKHAACTRPNYTCHCNRHHYPAQDKMSCLPRKDYGGSCSSDIECNHLRYFSCVQGKCGCDNGFQYHPKLNTCFVAIGDNCTRVNLFENPIFSGRYDSCPLNADCYKGKCVCRPSYKESGDGNCGRDYVESCGLDRPCSDLHFVCHSGRCVCKYPKHQIYYVESGTCFSIVPGPCTQTQEGMLEYGDQVSISCIPHAQCLKSQCRCRDQYKQNRDGLCVKPYGHDCTFDSECANNLKTKLACINNQCQCPDLLQKYDREVEMCLGKLGFRCSLDLNSTQANHCEQDLYCKAFGEENEYGLIGECVTKEEETEATTEMTGLKEEFGQTPAETEETTPSTTTTNLEQTENTKQSATDAQLGLSDSFEI